MLFRSVATGTAFRLIAVAMGEYIFTQFIGEEFNLFVTGGLAIAWYTGFQRYQVNVSIVALHVVMWWFDVSHHKTPPRRQLEVHCTRHRSKSLPTSTSLPDLVHIQTT